MKEKKKKVLEKIAKLLSLSADQAGTPEGETAKEMAEKLMKVHNIEKSEVCTGEGDEFGSMWMKCYPDQEGAKRWPVYLGQAIAKFFDTKLAFSQSPFAVCFIGLNDDVESSRFLFHKLMYFLEVKSFDDFPEKKDYKERSQFGQSASIRISERLQEIKKYMDEAEIEVPIKEEYQPRGSTKYSVVVSGKFLAKQKMELIERFMEQFKSNHETVEDENLKAQEPINREAWLKGYIAGSNAPLNQEVSYMETEKLS